MKILVIPDTQVKPGVPTNHLGWAADYAVKHKPDVIVHLGDHWDMPSLSSYDKGKKSFEGRRYVEDVKAGNDGMRALLAPIKAEQDRQRQNKHRVWKPRMVYLMGNHEERIERATNDAAQFDGLIGYDDLDLTGWEVVPFLKVAVIGGIAFSHYFTSGVMGRPVSSARALLTKKAMSCIMGHVQDRDIAYGKRADGTRMTSLFGGIFYQHDEGYLNAQTNESWRGIWMLNEVNNGQFDELPVSLDYLRQKYGELTNDILRIA